MKIRNSLPTAALLMVCLLPGPALAGVIYETTTAYHFIRVVEERGCRVLNFDDATQSRVSLRDPLQGHFEYTEYFRLPWLWNTQMTQVLMIGLGGGSTQRAFEHYCPQVTIDTAEIDPAVRRVAREFFQFAESPRQRVHVSDGRMFLRRSQAKYDCILLDAYVSSRYGSCIPHHLATKEFFELANTHLTTNGVLAYNVIGRARGRQPGIVSALYATLKTVFPQVYLFPARESENVVMIATKDARKVDLNVLRQRAAALEKSKQATFPGLDQRLSSFQATAPFNYQRATILTDDFAPIDGLLRL